MLHFVWKGVLVHGLRQLTGNDKSLNIWIFALCDDRLIAPLMKNILVDLNLKVAELTDQTSKRWDINNLLSL